jgi:hypothetical protein
VIAPMGRARLATLLAASVLVAGCFRYAPVDPIAVDPRDDVRVRLTTDAAVRIGLQLGSVQERWEGQLTPAGRDSLTLSLWVGQQYRGTPFENARQRVSLGMPEVVEVRRRELSRGRTALLAAGILALTVVLADRIVFDQDPNATPGGRPGSPPTDPSGTLVGRGVLR